MMQLAMFGIIGAAALNPQQPVPFESIVQSYFGVVLGFLLGALIQRLLWPLLPQWEMGRVLEHFFEGCLRLLDSHDPEDARQTAGNIGVLPAAAAAWLGHLRARDCPEDEQRKLRRFFARCAAMANALRITTRLGFDPGLTQAAQGILPAINQQKEELRRVFTALHDGFARRTSVGAPVPGGDEYALVRALDAERQSGRYLELDLGTAIRLFGYVSRRRRLQRRARECLEEFRALRLDRYMGDFTL